MERHKGEMERLRSENKSMYDKRVSNLSEDITRKQGNLKKLEQLESLMIEKLQ